MLLNLSRLCMQVSVQVTTSAALGGTSLAHGMFAKTARFFSGRSRVLIDLCLCQLDAADGTRRVWFLEQRKGKLADAVMLDEKHLSIIDPLFWHEGLAEQTDSVALEAATVGGDSSYRGNLTRQWPRL